LFVDDGTEEVAVFLVILFGLIFRWGGKSDCFLIGLGDLLS